MPDLTIPVDPNFGKGKDNPDPSKATPSPGGSGSDVVKDDVKGAEPKEPDTKAELEKIKAENEKLKKDNEYANMETEQLKKKLKEEEPPTKPETLKTYTNEELQDMLVTDPNKLLRIMTERADTQADARLLSNLGVSKEELINTVSLVKSQGKVSDQQNVAADKMIAKGLTKEQVKSEFDNYGSAIMEKLRSDPSLSQSPNGVYLAYLEVKNENGELSVTNVEQRAALQGGSVSPGAGETTALTEEEERAWNAFGLGDLKRDGEGKPAFTKADFKKQLTTGRGS